MLGNQGALGALFALSRYAQAASMIAIIGMTSNFIAEMITANITPSEVLVGTLSVVCIATLYCAITLILHLDALLPHLISSAIDALFMIALVVVAVVVGKPLSYLNCAVIGDSYSTASSALSFASALSNSVASGSGRIEYGSWIGGSRGVCLQMKSIWGLSVALCILFFLSSVSSVCLWRRNNAGVAPAGKGEA